MEVFCSMEHETGLEELISLYAIDALHGEERMKVEEHLKAGCEICMEILKETESAISLLPYSLEDAPLSSNVRKRVFERIESPEEGIKKRSVLVLLSSFIKPKCRLLTYILSRIKIIRRYAL